MKERLIKEPQRKSSSLQWALAGMAIGVTLYLGLRKPGQTGGFSEEDAARNLKDWQKNNPPGYRILYQEPPHVPNKIVL